MLGAVVLEHAPQVLDVRDRPQVAEEDRDPDQLLDAPRTRPSCRARPSRSSRRVTGSTKKRPTANASDRKIVKPQVLPEISSSGSVELGVGGDAERLHADLQRLVPAPPRRARSAAGSSRRCFIADSNDSRVDLDRARAARPSAPRRRCRRPAPRPPPWRPRPRARSRPPRRGGGRRSRRRCVEPVRRRSRAGTRTATAQVETPRIITPSSTAWPPIGASLADISRPSGEPHLGRRARRRRCRWSLVWSGQRS